MSYGMDGWNKPGGDTISRAEAIDLLDEQIAICNRALTNPSISMNDEFAVNVERNSLMAYRDKLECMPSAQPEWIPVTERLPEEEKKTYWVCTDGGDQHECRWTNTNPIWTHLTTNWHWNIFDIPQYSRVIAWMPLPEPYRKEGGE